MAVFNLGLVGAGRMGQNHLKAIAASEAVKVVAIAEPSGATRATLAKSGAVLHPDIDSMLSAGGLDGVLVCAPSDQHLDTVRRLVAAGLPILCEKPLGVIAQEAREAAKLA
ncbi:MAG: myo-inositol 2-dehydrogenase / D-chiro-inositol 1-dehydrogenase, partial [Chloroflexota bacterium]|nr:myo-inositol 2-dehydrogenase / D-chiro-inositol 1-dehydrogenase [Chloroflexota bacterium]